MTFEVTRHGAWVLLASYEKDAFHGHSSTALQVHNGSARVGKSLMENRHIFHCRIDCRVKIVYGFALMKPSRLVSNRRGSGRQADWRTRSFSSESRSSPPP